jgi:hypothetical protein
MIFIAGAPPARDFLLPQAVASPRPQKMVENIAISYNK